MLVEHSAQFTVELLFFDAFAVLRPRLKSPLTRPFEARRLRLVRAYQDHAIAVCLLGECAHVAAPAGDQNADAPWIMHCASRTSPRASSTCRSGLSPCSRG